MSGALLVSYTLGSKGLFFGLVDEESGSLQTSAGEYAEVGRAWSNRGGCTERSDTALIGTVLEKLLSLVSSRLERILI
jgi:hypothetical protein